MRAARLRRSGDIAALRTGGRSLRRAAFSARLRPTDRSETRLAVTAPRTIGGAVARNRARRRLREAFRQAIKSAAPAGSLDILVTARAESGAAEFRALVADATALLREAMA